MTLAKIKWGRKSHFGNKLGNHPLKVQSLDYH